MAVFTMKGVQDELNVFEDHLTLTPKGVLGFLNKGMAGTKDIPFASVTAVQFKRAGGLVNGYLQFSILGGVERKGGILGATKDENSFVFSMLGEGNERAEKIKEYIDSSLKNLRATTERPSAPSISDELLKLNELRQQGVLNEDEFTRAKSKLLDI